MFIKNFPAIKTNHMKKSFLTLIMSFTIACAFSQDISGTWAGIFLTQQIKNIPKNYYFFLEIKQKGRTVWGVYNTTDSNNNKSISCLCSISGSLPKKTGAIVDLYKEHIEDFDKNTVTYALCDFVNRLNLHYFIQDSTEYITGQWYSEAGGGPLAGGAGGLLVAQHISIQTMRNVDQYFPKLNKMIEKGATDEQTIAIKGDDISAAIPAEKRLLDAIKTIIAKK